MLGQADEAFGAGHGGDQVHWNIDFPNKSLWISHGNPSATETKLLRLRVRFRKQKQRKTEAEEHMKEQELQLQQTRVR